MNPLLSRLAAVCFFSAGVVSLFPSVAAARVVIYDGKSSGTVLGEGTLTSLAANFFVVADLDSMEWVGVLSLSFQGKKYYSVSRRESIQLRKYVGPKASSYSVFTSVFDDSGPSVTMCSGLDSLLTISKTYGKEYLPKTMKGNGFSADTTSFAQETDTYILNVAKSLLANEKGNSIDVLVAAEIKRLKTLGYISSE